MNDVFLGIGIMVASVLVGGVCSKIAWWTQGITGRYEIFAFVPYMVSGLIAGLVAPVAFIIGAVIFFCGIFG